jgi:hypothetical protein
MAPSHTVQLRIKEIVVFVSSGPDIVTIHFDLPPAMSGHDTPPMAKFEVRKGHGAAYVLEHFGIAPEVIGDRTGRRP